MQSDFLLSKIKGSGNFYSTRKELVCLQQEINHFVELVEIKRAINVKGGYHWLFKLNARGVINTSCWRKLLLEIANLKSSVSCFINNSSMTLNMHVQIVAWTKICFPKCFYQHSIVQRESKVLWRTNVFRFMTPKKFYQIFVNYFEKAVENRRSVLLARLTLF